MLKLINSEWIKLRTTKTLWITSILLVFFSLLLALLMGVGMGITLSSDEVTRDPLAYVGLINSVTPELAISGFGFMGILFIIIQASMMVTTEYNHNTSKTTLLATPQRWPVPLAKTVVYAAIAAVISLITLVLSVVVMRWALSWNVDLPQVLDRMNLSFEGTWRLIGMYVLYAVLLVPLCVGVGYVVRHTAGAIAAIFLWKLVVEAALVPAIPKIRDWLPQYMPFNNAESGVTGVKVPDAPWDANGSVVYFAVWVLVIFVVGAITLKKRDA